MKRIFYILTLILLFGCDSDNVSDCLQTSGKLVHKEMSVQAFDKILVNRDVVLVVQQGIDHSVRIETGENLLNDIDVKIIDNQLQLTDNNTCNYVREYGITTIYVTVPDLKEIRSSTQYDISSKNVLVFDNLTLISEDYNEKESFPVGDFRLEVDTNKLRIVTNNISSQYISGKTNDLYVGYFAGAGRFEGANLIAQHVQISHRGSNDMIVNPQQSLTGVLRGVGDLISINRPSVVDVEQLYSGSLIFN